MSRLPRHAGEPSLPPPLRLQEAGHQCPLCGLRFTNGVQVCGSCGLSGGCEAIGCPHCGYQFPLESVTLAFVGRLWRRLRRSLNPGE